PPARTPLSLHAALPIYPRGSGEDEVQGLAHRGRPGDAETFGRLDRASGDRRDDGVAKAEARRFGEAGLEARDLAEFAGQARLARSEEHTSELQSRENLV